MKKIQYNLLSGVFSTLLILLTENFRAEVEHSGFAVRMAILLIYSSRMKNFVYGDFLIQNILAEKVKGMYVAKNMITTGESVWKQQKMAMSFFSLRENWMLMQ